MVTASNRGGFFARFAQRAASSKSAVESGPPDTATTKLGKSSRPRNSASNSSSPTAASAVGTLLFPLHVLLHRERCARILAHHFAERRTGGFLLAQCRKRLAEPQQRIRRPRRGLVFGRDGEEGFGGVVILLALEQRLAEPVLRLRSEPVPWMFVQEVAVGLRGVHIVLVHEVAVGEFVLVLGRGVRRQRRKRAGAVRAGRRRRRGAAGRAVVLRTRQVREIERRPGLPRRRRLILIVARAKRARRPGRAGTERRIERVMATAARGLAALDRRRWGRIW